MIKLCIATVQNVRTEKPSDEFDVSLARTFKYFAGKYDIDVNFTRSAYVHLNRNMASMDAIKHNVDYILFIDSDMKWQPTDIEKLVESNKNVASGVYISRMPLYKNERVIQAYYYTESEGFKPLSCLPKEPCKVDAVGAGFLLIKKNVLEHLWNKRDKLGAPFDLISFREAKCGRGEMTDLIGEDFAFCLRIKRLGYELWLHPEVKVGHLIERCINPV